MEEIKLTDAQLTKALRCCTKDPGDLDGCRSCTLEIHWEGADGVKCYDRLVLQAADRLEELTEENRRMRDATEEICQRQVAQMIRWAGEANISAERELPKVNQAQIDEILICQRVLTELGRESVIRLKPIEDGADRVLVIRVGETVIFGSLEEDGEDDGTCG